MWTYVLIGAIVVLVVLLCLALAISRFAFDGFKEKLEEIDTLPNSQHLSTLEYVSIVNQNSFGGKLKLAKCKKFDDHYGAGTVALSEETMSSNSLASLAVVSHELGHARQDFEGDMLKKHFLMRRTGKFFGVLFMPLLIVGAILSCLYVFGIFENLAVLIVGLSLIGFALLIFVFAIVLKYKEIQIEKDASNKALEFLKEFLEEDEIEKCQQLLNSARLTYWAGLFRTLLGWTHLTGKEKMFK